MRSYKADLSRRLGPIFSEMAARAASLGPYRDAKDEVCVNLTAEQAGWCKDCNPDNCGGCATQAVLAKAYKPAHGGYPTVKAQA